MKFPTIFRSAAIALFVLTALVINPMLAQDRTGAVNGMVTDQSGAVVPGVIVKITSVGTNRTLTAMTGTDGTYAFRTLEPGRYNITFELARFTKVERKEVAVPLAGVYCEKPFCLRSSVKSDLTATS